MTVFLNRGIFETLGARAEFSIKIGNELQKRQNGYQNTKSSHKIRPKIEPIEVFSGERTQGCSRHNLSLKINLKKLKALSKRLNRQNLSSVMLQAFTEQLYKQ